MCGIVGLAGALEFKHRAVLKDMLVCSTLRGNHATGVLAVENDKKMGYLKRGGQVTDFLDLKGADDAMNGTGRIVLLGHTRHATQGAAHKTANAHPFIIEDDDEEFLVGGVHNGTLDTGWRRDLEGGNNFDVDSEALLDNIARNGIEETIPKVSGAWALVWWDQEQKTLNFLRNEKRTLFLAFSQDHSVLAWASEPWMLLVAERRGDLVLERIKDSNGDETWYFPLPVDKLFSFEINRENKTKKDERTFNLKPIKEVKGSVSVVRNHNWSWNKQNESIGGYKPAETKKTEDSKGGSVVTHPFLDDDFKDLFPKKDEETKTADESKTTKPSTVVSLLTSANSKGSKTEQTTSGSSSRNRTLLSLPGTPTVGRTTRNGCSNVSRTSNPSCSVRTVAGQRYITKQQSSEELLEADFRAKAGNSCCTCKEETALEDVGIIIAKGHKFLCKECLVEPKEIKIA